MKTLVMGIYDTLDDHHLKDMKIVVGDDVPKGDIHYVTIMNCIFDRCDLSELRNTFVNRCIMRECKLPPNGDMPTITFDLEA